MNSNVQNKIKAITLRMQGYTYSDIMKEVPVSKSTLSGWMTKVSLTNEQEKIYLDKIKVRQGIAKFNAVATNRAQKQARIENTEKEALKIFDLHKNDPDFLVGLSLYWAEGTKKDVTFSFINSDPEMVLFMYRWILKYINPDKNRIKVRLFIHLVYETEHLESFWANLLDISLDSMQKTIYKPTVHTIKKNQEYKGCVRMYITGIHYLRTVILWKESLVKGLHI